MRSYLDGLRPVLVLVFLAGYVWQTFAPASFGTDLFLGVGAILFVISVPWSSAFHRAFALVAFLTLGAVIFTGRFELGDFLQGMPTYFGIVAVLLVLSIAGYPIQAARYEAQIRALMAALTVVQYMLFPKAGGFLDIWDHVGVSGGAAQSPLSIFNPLLQFFGQTLRQQVIWI